MTTRYGVGDRVRMVADYQYGTSTLRGDEGEIVHTPSRADGIYTVQMLTGPRTGDRYDFRRQHFEHAPVKPTAYEPTAEHVQDVALIAERMREVAESEDWCDEGYNEVAEELNRVLRVKIPLMESEYTVTIQGEHYDGSGLFGNDDAADEVTIEATSEDEAVEKVTDIVNRYLRGELVEKPKG